MPIFITYIKIACRNLSSHRLFSVLNITGLVVGMTTCLLISCFVHFENQYDKQLNNADQIYRVSRHYAEQDMHLAAIAAPFKDLLKTRFSDIEAIGQLGMSTDTPFRRGDTSINMTNILMADSDIFDVLEFNLLAGSLEHALDRVNTAVLTESTAQLFFGNEDPIGQHILIYEQYPVEITAVIRDIGEQSHLKFNMLISLQGMRNWVPEDFVNWDFNNFYTYIRLKPGISKSQLEEKFPALLAELNDHVSPDQSLRLQAIGDIHLHSNLKFEMQTNGSATLVYSFAAIALVIMLIACVNFMNLSTACASQRAKEVGIRKALGASRGQLIGQFLGESILLCTIALIISLAAVELSLPWFSAFVEKPLSLELIYNLEGLSLLFLFTLIVGGIAGSYPAFYLSSFQPADVLKGGQTHGSGATQLRKVLVVIQFSISITLIISTLVVIQQTAYARAQDPGYDRQNNVVISLSSAQGAAQGFADPNRFYITLRDKLIQHPHIISVAAAQQLPTMALRDIWSYVREQDNITADTMISLPTLNASYHFFDHYQIPLLAGRYFSEQLGDDYVQVPTAEQPLGKGIAVISRSAAKTLGYRPNEAINKIIKIPFPPGSTNYRIVGVVEDIHLGSLKEEQKPQVYHLVKNNERFVSVRIDEQHAQQALDYIDQTWTELVGEHPISRHFLDESFNAMYKSEDKQALLFSLFSLLAIIVACLGLFGLVAFTAERRKKEIGIRKVMGASVSNIVLLLTNEFSILVLIANLLAWPVTYFLMQHWLSGFQKAINLNLGMFILSGLAALLIAWLTVATYAIRSANNRPINSLRYE